MRLSDLLIGLNYTLVNTDKTPDDIIILNVSYNSSKCNSSSLFICIKGATVDGHDYAEDAYKNGAIAFVCEHKLNLPAECFQIIVQDTKIALAIISSNWFNHPEKSIGLIGITGTKGKTSCAYMISKILNDNGIKTGIIGTCGVELIDHTLPTNNTTPLSYDLYEYLDLMRKDNYSYCVLEVSSQALKLDRVYGLNFDYAIYTNLSIDHIGVNEHESFEEYKECKKKLFQMTNTAIINRDDSYGQEFIDSSKCNTYSYSLENDDSDIFASNVNCNKFDTSFTVDGVSFKIPFPGKYAVYNALSATLTAKLIGLDINKSSNSLTSVNVPGRFQIVKTNKKDVCFIIDYAHNEDSLGNLLSNLEPKNRLVCVFGSVGERSQLRRKELALVASKYADLSIITSDNPNHEPPEKITKEISGYMTGQYIVIDDRTKAIEYAVNNSEPGDIVVFAGKGHEKYQLVNGIKQPFDEEKLIKEFANK